MSKTLFKKLKASFRVSFYINTFLISKVFLKSSKTTNETFWKFFKCFFRYLKFTRMIRDIYIIFIFQTSFITSRTLNL